MNQHPAAARLALQAVVAKAGENAQRILATQHQRSSAQTFAALDEHRTAVIADLLDALNVVEPELGDLLLEAMYPFGIPWKCENAFASPASAPIGGPSNPPRNAQAFSHLTHPEGGA